MSLVSGLCLLSLLTTAHAVRADTVQLSLHDGRVTIVADRATPAEILQTWGRIGDVTIVNAERMQAVPLTLRLDDMPEEQALDILLRSAGGYLARRRDNAASGSVFDRIVITAAASPREAPSPAPTPGTPPGTVRPVFPQTPPPVVAAPPPTAVTPNAPGAPPRAGVQPPGIPVAPGVTRLVGADGQPVADDQDNAPAPDANRPAGAPPAPPPYPQPQPQPPSTPPAAAPSTSAPAGVPRPGMAVPAPNQPPPSPGQPRR